jgi:hypothetical protein
MTVEPEFTQVGTDKIICSTYRLRPDGSRQDRYQMIAHRGEKITDMQGFASRRQAGRFARPIVGRPEPQAQAKSFRDVASRFATDASVSERAWPGASTGAPVS